MKPSTHATLGTSRKKQRKSELSTALLAGLAALLLSSIPLHAQVLLNDTFTNSTRTNQDLPNSAHWYAGGGGSTLIVTNNTLRLLTDGVQRQTVVYFTDSGTQTLGVGDSLSVSFSFLSSAYETTSDFRFGLFDSGSSRVTADNLGNNPTNGVYADYKGYALISNFGTATNGSTLRARTVTTNSLFTPSAFSTLSGSTSGLGLTNGDTYYFTLTLTADSATDMSLNILVKDSSDTTLINFSTTDTTNYHNNFDTFAFMSGTTSGNPPTNATGAAIFLDDVLITYSPVPEPGTTGMMLLGTCFALGLVLWRRRASRLG